MRRARVHEHGACRGRGGEPPGIRGDPGDENAERRHTVTGSVTVDVAPMWGRGPYPIDTTPMMFWPASTCSVSPVTFWPSSLQR